MKLFTVLSEVGKAAAMELELAASDASRKSSTHNLAVANEENAALKARVEELEGLIATVQHAAGNCICVLCVESRAIRARRQTWALGKSTLAATEPKG